MLHKMLLPPRNPDGTLMDIEEYYNADTGLIMLEGERGPMLAHYDSDKRPELNRFVFLTAFDEKYPVYKTPYDGLPDQAPADICARAVPVEEFRDPRQVKTGIMGKPVSGKESAGGHKHVISATQGSRKTQDGMQEGISVGINRIEAFSGSGGAMTLGPDGVSIEGGFNQPDTTSKGMTQQSPLFGIIPKTAITFFASDYLPKIELVQEMAQWVNSIRAIPDLYRAVQKITEATGFALPDVPDTGRDARRLSDAINRNGYQDLDGSAEGIGGR